MKKIIFLSIFALPYGVLAQSVTIAPTTPNMLNSSKTGSNIVYIEAKRDINNIRSGNSQLILSGDPIYDFASTASQNYINFQHQLLSRWQIGDFFSSNFANINDLTSNYNQFRINNIGTPSTTPFSIDKSTNLTTILNLNVNSNFKLMNMGEADGKFLKSDALGNASWAALPTSLWQTAGAGGNEIQNINAGGFWSSNPTIVPYPTNNLHPPTAPTAGAGTRMMWIPSRSAFRCGTVNGDAWDATNIGLHSFAIGYNAEATGTGNVAIGINSLADGTSNTFAFGENTQSTGTNAVSFGTGCNAPSYYSVAMGYYNIIPTANATSWVASDPLFTIGNGQSSGARSNAFLMLKNGKTAIGNITPQSFLHVFESESGAIPNANSMATFEKNGIGYVSLLTPEASESGISFGVPSSSVSGGIYYNSAGVKGLQFRANGNSIKMSILANGNVGIGVSPSAKLDVNGDVKLGVNGTAINEIIKVTVNANLASIAAVSTISKTFTVNNAAVGSTVYVSPNDDMPDGIVIANARVSAVNTVAVKFTNITAVAINPLAMDYHITVIR